MIDNEQVLLNEFISMANEYASHGDYATINLSEAIQVWFENWLEDKTIDVTAKDVGREYGLALTHVYRSILTQAIQDIGYDGWIDIAEHYITKATESNQ